MENIRRYTVIAIEPAHQNNKQSRQIEIQLPHEEEKNCFLSSIDLFTLEYNNEQDLIKLLSHQINKAGFDPYFVKIRIAYKSNNKIKILMPVYSDKKIIKEYALKSESKVPLYLANHFFTKVESDLKNGYFINFLKESNLLSERMKIKTRDLINSQEQLNLYHFHQNKIIDEFLSYKVIRGFIIGYYSYSKSHKMDMKKLELKETKVTQKNNLSGEYYEYLDKAFQRDLDQMTEEEILEISDSNNLRRK